jgi:WD40 repeat protein
MVLDFMRRRCKDRDVRAASSCQLSAAALALALLPGCGGAPEKVAPPHAAKAPAAGSAKAALPPEVATGTIPEGAKLLPPEGPPAKITCLSFSPDGRRIVSGSSDQILLLWDVETGHVVQRLEGHHGYVSSCAFLPDGRRLTSGGRGGELFVWDVAGGTPRRLGQLGASEDIYSLAVRRDGREVIVGTSSGFVRAWDVETGHATFPDETAPSSPSKSKIWIVGYMDDGSRFGGNEGGQLLLWSPTAAGPPRLIDSASIGSIAIKGERLAFEGEGEIAAVHPEDPVGSRKTLGLHQGVITSFATSPRRDLMVTGDLAGHTRVWNFADDSLRCELPRSGGILATAFDPTGERFAAAGNDGAVFVAKTGACKPGSLVQPTILRADLRRSSLGIEPGGSAAARLPVP